MTVYDDVDLEDMQWSGALGAYTYECPCGDVFQITETDLRAGEEIASCPSCTLVIHVIYDPDDFASELGPSRPSNIKCVVPEDH